MFVLSKHLHFYALKLASSNIQNKLIEIVPHSTHVVMKAKRWFKKYSVYYSVWPLGV